MDEERLKWIASILHTASCNKAHISECDWVYEVRGDGTSWTRPGTVHHAYLQNAKRLVDSLQQAGVDLSSITVPNLKSLESALRAFKSDKHLGYGRDL